MCLSLLFACGGGAARRSAKSADAAAATTIIRPEEVPYIIKNTYPHSRTSYTQGLFWYDGSLWESTGEYGHSRLMRVRLEDGSAERSLSLPASDFGEGAVALDSLIYMLTWQEERVYVYDAATLKLLKTFDYRGEGWGLTTDGEWLYFTSDMPGGMGGLDIWRVRLTAAGTGGVENLGEPVNTPGDETFPTFRPNGDLYFSSDGHPGMGGLDIYIAKPDSAGGTWHIEHPGFPLNSQGDDFGMTFEGLHNRGFFSSNRGDAKGWDHIYSFVNPEIIQTVKGWVYEQEGYELPEAIVYMVGNDGTNLKLSVKGDGSFTQQIRPGVDYVFLGTCKGFLNHKEQLRVEPVTESEEYVLQFPLPSITAPVLIDNIFYDFDKATLRPESTKALDELIKLLNENPNVTIELSAHCDYRGAIGYNRVLSQKRAESVVNYLVEHGIAADRLSPVGYGKEKPKTIRKKLTETYTFLKEGDVLTEDFIRTLKPEEQEICNQLNRRTEFIVLRTTYGMFDERGNLKNPPEPKPAEEQAPAEPEWSPW